MHLIPNIWYSNLTFFFFGLFVFLPFLGLLPRHMEVPRPEVKVELQLLAYATATWDRSHICDLHHSSWQHLIPNPLIKARDGTRNFMVPSWIRFCCTMMGTPTAFLYTNKERSEREIRETVPLIIALKRIKYLGINPPKETNDLHSENHKTMMKEIKDDTNRCKDIPCSWIRRINIIK